jgi:hypothetical protein
MTWDLMLSDRLPVSYQPGVFSENIPLWLTIAENSSRTIVFLLAVLMPLSLRARRQKAGLFIYLAGLLLYFFSWLILIFFPYIVTNAAAFMAPAYTPLIWLTGIALIAEKFYFHIPFRRWYFMAAVILFLVLHNFHAYMIFERG